MLFSPWVNRLRVPFGAHSAPAHFLRLIILLRLSRHRATALRHSLRAGGDIVETYPRKQSKELKFFSLTGVSIV